MSEGLLLSDDLIFTSRIVGTAQHHGLTIRTVRDQQTLLNMAEGDTIGCVIVDLSNPSLVIEEVTARLHEARPHAPRVVAYGSHVDTATLKRAREAGCDLVLPRSKFVEDLPVKLPEWLSR